MKDSEKMIALCRVFNHYAVGRASIWVETHSRAIYIRSRCRKRAARGRLQTTGARIVHSPCLARVNSATEDNASEPEGP